MIRWPLQSGRLNISREGAVATPTHNPSERRCVPLRTDCRNVWTGKMSKVPSLTCMARLVRSLYCRLCSFSVPRRSMHWALLAFSITTASFSWPTCLLCSSRANLKPHKSIAHRTMCSSVTFLRYSQLLTEANSTSQQGAIWCVIFISHTNTIQYRTVVMNGARNHGIINMGPWFIHTHKIHIDMTRNQAL